MLLRDCLAVFGAVLVTLGALAALRGERAPQKDELGFLQVAHDLRVHGSFTDGGYVRAAEEGAPGRFLAPAYPMLVFALSAVDPGLQRAIDCHVATPAMTRAECGGSFASLIAVQAALFAAAAVAIFAIALMLTQSRLLALLATGLAVATGEMPSLTRLFLSESIALPAFLGFLACAVAWADGRRSWRIAAGAGVFLALAALARPSYLYLLYAVIAVALAAALISGRTERGRVLVSVVAFGLAGILVLVPWMVRNTIVFGDPALTGGYAAFTLSQRVAYNAMTWTEWLVAWVYWLPDFGDNLVKALLPKSDYVRLGWTDPTSFYLTGAGPLFSETLAAAGSAEAHLGYLLRERVAGDLGWHTTVTLPLTWRGIWAGGYLALVAALLAPAFARHAARNGKLAALAALAVPLFFMAGLHGFVSVNIVRYNEAMIALWAVIVAWAACEAVRRIVGRRTPAP